MIEYRRLHDFIPEVKDYYTIDTEGNLYSDNSGKMKTRDKKGTEYKLINVQLVDGRKKTYRVHRLMMMCFRPIENSDGLEVNHIDGDKSNNNINNLEWCTRSENQHHAYEVGLASGRKGEKSNFAKLSENDIKEIFKLRKEGLKQREIAEIFDCSRSNISYILNKKTWQN